MERQPFDICKCRANGDGTPRWTVNLSTHVYSTTLENSDAYRCPRERGDQELLLPDTYATTHGEEVMSKPHLPSAALFGCALCATAPTYNIPLFETNSYSTHARQQRRQTRIKICNHASPAQSCALYRRNRSQTHLPSHCPNPALPLHLSPRNQHATKQNKKRTTRYKQYPN